MSRVPPSQPKRGRMTVEEFRQWKQDIHRIYPDRYSTYKPKPIEDDKPKPLPNLYDEET